MNEGGAKKDALDAESRLEWYEMAAEGRDYCGNKWPTKQNDNPALDGDPAAAIGAAAPPAENATTPTEDEVAPTARGDAPPPPVIQTPLLQDSGGGWAGARGGQDPHRVAK